MGFVGNIDMAALTKREMGTRDFIWLAALGTAARGPAGLDDICRAIDVITLGQWLPVGELITASVDEMMRGGHLQAVNGLRTASSTELRLRLTGRGRETLSLLLAQPTARPSSVFGQVGLRMKLAFLDLVDGGERRAHLDSLIGLYEDDLNRRMSPGESCPARGNFGDLWRSHDIERMRRDIALLRSMAGMAGPGAGATRH
ncbi:MAG: hypothetical protein NVV74_00940 [Magnetospirillum sp.]|nr:hypothetical protein [Magnetospirillum sp.]